MRSITSVAALATAISRIPLSSAHGIISGIVSDGKWYSGTSPNWIYGTKPDSAGWYAMNQDTGYVAPDAYGNGDIICHKNATVGGTPIPMTAGSLIELQWTTWPESHHGPVITYMAAVSGDFASVDKTSLEWFKVAEGGLINGSIAPGVWASDDMISNNNTATFTIPSSLKAGNYVVRNEIIALHSAGQEDGAQNYPQCINVKVSSSGSDVPFGIVGTSLYKSTDPGILINIYTSLSNYTIPGPTLVSGSGSSSNSTLSPSGSASASSISPLSASASASASESVPASISDGSDCTPVPITVTVTVYNSIASSISVAPVSTSSTSSSAPIPLSAGNGSGIRSNSTGVRTPIPPCA